MTLIAGMGKTGLSAARFLARRGESFAAADSRSAPPLLAEWQARFPRVELHLGAFDAALFVDQRRIITSPGIPLQESALRAAAQAGVEVLGDIELFARYADAPVVGISGSNGKSTVTTLLAEMATGAGLAVRVGGNLGTPALDLLLESDEAGAPDLYLLELSSFQLESVSTLNCRAASVLNLSADHLDRHGSLTAYAAIKRRIFRGDGVQVLNADDEQVRRMAESGRTLRWFGLGAPVNEQDYGLLQINDQSWLAQGKQPVLPCAELKVAGQHNWANALAALALGDALGLERAPMLAALRAFTGLPHRCQRIASMSGVDWYDDSKGTNVGSTVAALTGMPANKVVLIAGGDGKGQDFSPLRAAVAAHARAVVLIGRDAPLIAEALADAAPIVQAGDSLERAVSESALRAQPGDAVLLSPACASFDMFADYVQRAEAFRAAVQGLAA